MARVLVIDDEPDVVRLIVKVLSGKGHTVQIARDGASALARVKHEPPDVILLDSDLPKIVVVHRHLRRRRGGRPGLVRRASVRARRARERDRARVPSLACPASRSRS
jgi:CheY-like chemotaxis protein